MSHIDSLSTLMGDIIREAVRTVMREEFEERPQVQPRLLDAKQAARYIGRKASTVYKLAQKGKIPVASSDTKRLFDRRDLDAYIEREKNAG